MSPEYPFDEAATARAVIDDDGVLVEWGAGAERLLGHRAADVVGRPAAELLADRQGSDPRRATAGTASSPCAAATAARSPCGRSPTVYGRSTAVPFAGSWSRRSKGRAPVRRTIRWTTSGSSTPLRHRDL